MKTIKLTNAQQRELARVTELGRKAVGRFGGIPRPTANVLVKLGLVTIRTEHSLGRLRDYAYPV